MGRTIVSATQTWNEEDAALKRFTHALRKNDRDLIEELIALSHSHVAEASYASNLYPMDVYLVSMLLELYKKVKKLEHELQQNGLLPSEYDQIEIAPASLISLITQAESEATQSIDLSQEDDLSSSTYIDLEEGV